MVRIRIGLMLQRRTLAICAPIDLAQDAGRRMAVTVAATQAAIVPASEDP
jgi:hypothetical protein